MTECVLDASLAAAWLLPEEHSEAAETVIGTYRQFVAPSLFWFELRNILVMAERRNRIAAGQAHIFLRHARRLPLEDAGSGLDDAVLNLSRQFELSAYDAAYLALAIDRTLPLASLDRRLAKAAKASGLEVAGPLAV